MFSILIILDKLWLRYVISVLRYRRVTRYTCYLQIMRSDTSMDSLNVTRSESVTDLNTELNGILHSRRASTGHTRNDENFVSAPVSKPFGIGKQMFASHLLHFSSETFSIIIKS